MKPQTHTPYAPHPTPYPAAVLLLAAALIAPALHAQAPTWSVNANNHELSMTVLGALYFDGSRSLRADDVVGAFVGTEVRGVKTPILVDGQMTFFMVIHGEDGEAVTFKVYDATTDRVEALSETFTFVGDGSRGTFASPYTWQATRTPPDGSAPEVPADGATDLAVDVALSWQSAPGATGYDVQLALSDDFASPTFTLTDHDQTAHTVTGLAQGETYYWRVRGRNSGGTSAWSATYRFTTVPAIAAPEQVILLAPADGATRQETSLLLSWQDATGADTYEFNISTAGDFSSIMLRATDLTTGQLQIQGLAEGKGYYWRVRAHNAGGPGPWSTPFVFTTAVSIILPDVPALASPEDGADGQDLAPSLAWQAAAEASSYDVQVATDANFSGMVTSQVAVSGTAFTTSSLDPTTTYYWRVRGRNDGGTSAWSSPFSFTTRALQPPALPVLTSPADGADDQGREVTLVWQAAALATSYDVQLATDDAFAALIVDKTSITDTEYAGDGGRGAGIDLDYNTTYYWRVRSRNGDGVGDWTAAFRFTTIMEPSVLSQSTLLAPKNGAVDQETHLWLVWQAVENATRYEYQVSTDLFFGTIAFTRSDIEGTAIELLDLAPGTKYYWRVRAHNADGAGAWAIPFTFTTAAAAVLPSTPVLTAPTDGSVNQPTHLWLVWQAAADADAYDLQLSPHADFSADVIEHTGLTDVLFEVMALSTGTTYHWRIRGTNAVGAGPWSVAFRFTTVTGTANEEEGAVVTAHRLEGNYPNPFNPRTVVRYAVATAGHVSLEVYDVQGRHVASLVDGYQGAGRYEVTFEAGDLTSGLYLCRYRMEGFSAVHKMLLLR